MAQVATVTKLRPGPYRKPPQSRKSTRATAYIDMVQCMGYAHDWDRDALAPDWVPTPKRGHYTLYSRCDRCGAEKIETNEIRTGAPVSSKYYYPDRYHEEKLTRREAKAMFIAAHRKKYT